MAHRMIPWLREMNPAIARKRTTITHVACRSQRSAFRPCGRDRGISHHGQCPACRRFAHATANPASRGSSTTLPSRIARPMARRRSFGSARSSRRKSTGDRSGGRGSNSRSIAAGAQDTSLRECCSYVKVGFVFSVLKTVRTRCRLRQRMASRLLLPSACLRSR